jgi:hypothetical protein
MDATYVSKMLKSGTDHQMIRVGKEHLITEI